MRAYEKVRHDPPGGSSALQIPRKVLSSQRRTGSVATLAAIAKALDVELDDLIGD